MSHEAVSCWLYSRTTVEGGFQYDQISVRSWQRDGPLSTEHPPALGDQVSLPDGGSYVVIGRSWMHSAYGSPNWPLGEKRPRTGPMLQLIVEAAEGLFVDQVEVERPDGSVS